LDEKLRRNYRDVRNKYTGTFKRLREPIKPTSYLLMFGFARRMTEIWQIALLIKLENEDLPVKNSISSNPSYILYKK